MASSSTYVKSNLSSSSSGSESDDDDSSSSSSSSSQKSLEPNSEPKDTSPDHNRSTAPNDTVPEQGQPTVPKVAAPEQAKGTVVPCTGPDHAKTQIVLNTPGFDGIPQDPTRHRLILSISKGAGNNYKARRRRTPKPLPKVPFSPPRKVSRYVNNVQTRFVVEEEIQSTFGAWPPPLPPKPKPLTLAEIPKSLYTFQTPDEDPVPLAPKVVQVFDEAVDVEYFPVSDDIKDLLCEGVLPGNTEFEFMYSYGLEWKTITPHTSHWGVDNKTRVGADDLRKRIATKGAPRFSELEDGVEFDILVDYDTLLNEQLISAPMLPKPDFVVGPKITATLLQDGTYRVQLKRSEGEDRVILFPKVSVNVEQVSDEVIKTMTTPCHRLFSDHPYFQAKLKIYRSKRQKSPVRKLSPGQILAKECLKPPVPRFLPDENRIERAIRLAKEKYRGKEWNKNPETQDGPPKRKAPMPNPKSKVNKASAASSSFKPTLATGGRHKKEPSRKGSVSKGVKKFPMPMPARPGSQVPARQNLPPSAPRGITHKEEKPVQLASSSGKEKYGANSLKHPAPRVVEHQQEIPKQLATSSAKNKYRGNNVQHTARRAVQHEQEIPSQWAIISAKDKFRGNSSQHPAPRVVKHQQEGPSQRAIISTKEKDRGNSFQHPAPRVVKHQQENPIQLATSSVKIDRGKDLDKKPKPENKGLPTGRIPKLKVSLLNSGSKVKKVSSLDRGRGMDGKEPLVRVQPPGQLCNSQRFKPLATRYVHNEVQMPDAAPSAREKYTGKSWEKNPVAQGPPTWKIPKLNRDSPSSRDSASTADRTGWFIDNLLDPLPLEPFFGGVEKVTPAPDLDRGKEQMKKHTRKDLEIKSAAFKESAPGPSLVVPAAADGGDLDVLSIGVDEDDSWLFA